MLRQVAILALLCAATARSASASPLELFGFGSRSSAMAGTGVAISDEFDSVYTNPAGLAEVEGRQLNIGTMFGRFGLEMNGNDTDTDDARGVIWGGAFRLPLGGALSDRIGLGIGLFVPSEALVRVDVPLPGVPVFALLETRSHVIGVMTSFGIKLTDRLSVGAGALANAALRGAIFIDVDGAGRFRANSEQRTITNIAALAGARYRLGPDLVLGLTLRAPSKSDYEIVVTNDLAESLPLSLPTLTIAGTAQYDPGMVAAEAGWRLRPWALLVGQLTYQRWSAFPLPTKNPLVTGASQEPPDFHDTVVPRVAAELTIPSPVGDRVVGRLGYAFVMSPAPEMDGQQSLLDNHRHVASGGLGVAWTGRDWPLSIDAWVQLHSLMPRTHTKDPDNFADPEQMPFDSIVTDGRIWVGGVSLGVTL